MDKVIFTDFGAESLLPDACCFIRYDAGAFVVQMNDLPISASTRRAPLSEEVAYAVIVKTERVPASGRVGHPTSSVAYPVGVNRPASVLTSCLSPSFPVRTRSACRIRTHRRSAAGRGTRYCPARCAARPAFQCSRTPMPRRITPPGTNRSSANTPNARWRSMRRSPARIVTWRAR